jgi:magnesium transporter
MRTIYKSTERGLVTIPDITEGCWIHVTQPDEPDLAWLESLGLPADLLTHAADPDERPRTERDDGTVLIVLRFPYAQGAHTDVPFVTVPLTVLVSERLIVTITPQTTGFLQKFAAGHVRGLTTGKRTRFVLNLFLHIANEYLTHLRQINAAVDAVEDRLQQSLRNREVLELLKYQKSLVYFTTALKSNELVLERLEKGRLLQLYADDDDLFDDVMIEFRQAIEVTEISQNILSSMMDAFASIISNNLNAVMKFLASATIVISLPTLVASFYGMNVPLPGANHPFAFPIVLGVSLFIAGAVVLAFRRKDWL